jgi:hypothetical protein
METKQYLRQFEEFLSQKESENQDKPIIDYEQIKEEWLAKNKEFYSLIQKFLHDYLEQGKIVTEWKTVELSEELLGQYEVQQLILKIGNTRIVFTPIGRIVIGTLGRIDMSSDLGSVRFVVVSNESNAELIWKIITPPPEVLYLDVTEESFFEALMEIING